MSIRQPTARPTRKIVIVMALGLVTLVVSTNQTVFAPALPTMVGELHGVDEMNWVITGYWLGSVSTMMAYGRISDHLGRRTVLLAALSVFAVGAIIGGLALNMNMLIIARLVQGLGAGGLIILAQAGVADVVPPRERGKYQAVLSSIFAVSTVGGPLVGGFLTAGPGWRWTFWVSLALVAIAAVCVAVLLPRSKRATEPLRTDFAGIALLATTTTSVVLLATWGGHEFPWSSPITIGLAVVAAGAIAGFILVERRVANPIMPPKLFKERNFLFTTIAAIGFGTAMTAVVSYMPTYLQMVTGATPVEAGYLMLPVMGVMIVTSIACGQLIARTGRYKLLPIVGAAAVAAGLFLLSRMEPATPVALICVFLGIIGLGLGLSLQVLTVIVQNTFPHAMLGTATAGNNFFRQIGSTFGIAIIGALFTSRVAQLLTERLPDVAGSGTSITPEIAANLPAADRAAVILSYNEALAPIYFFIVPMVLIAFVALLFIREKPLARKLEEEILTESLSEGELVSK